MPISPDEIAKHAPALAAFGAELVAAFGPESDGGKKLTPKELGKLAKKGLGLLGLLLVDLVD
jgi:hypothetical protein